MTNLFHSKVETIDPDHTESGRGFMQQMLSGLADGTATGITKWYAERYVAGRPHRTAALSGLKRLRTRLQASGAMGNVAPVSRALRHLTVPRIAILEARLDEIDAKEATQ